MDGRPSLVRELAHEIRDALSPIRAAIDLLPWIGAKSVKVAEEAVRRGVGSA